MKFQDNSYSTELSGNVLEKTGVGFGLIFDCFLRYVFSISLTGLVAPDMPSRACEPSPRETNKHSGTGDI